jgi:dipeptidyl aminopeptidase/acylaminoacyl peptidase
MSRLVEQLNKVLKKLSKPHAGAFLYFPENPAWSHQVMRGIVEAQNGGGDFGEISRTADRMKIGDPESWHSEWKSLAEYVEKIGGSAESTGLVQTAMQSYFRASNYYREADFYLDRDDPREPETYRKHVDLFQRAGALRTPKIEPISIPFEGKMLHGYFVRSTKERDSKQPCVIMFGGADSTCEEVYFSSVPDAIARGLNVLLMDGPGQGYTLRFEKLYARFDYEKTVAAAIDFLASTRSDFIDIEKIGVLGRSLGGYYASRSAAMEKRVKAAVVFDAIFNVLDNVYDFFPPVRRAINWDVGARTEAEAREKLAKFDLTGVAEKINCPIMIIHGRNDYISSPKAADRLYYAIPHPDKILKWYEAGHGVSMFRAESMAYVSDWLAEKLA